MDERNFIEKYNFFIIYVWVFRRVKNVYAGMHTTYDESY